MDGTLADFAQAMLSQLRRLNPPGTDLTRALGDDVPDYIREQKRLIKRQPGFWRELPELWLGMHFLRKLRNLGFEVHVLTNGPGRNSLAWAEKLEWCREHLPEDVQVTVTQDKGLVYGRVLVDDFPPYITRWLDARPRGVVVMPAHAYNEGFTHERVVRVTEETRNHSRPFLLAARDRRPGEPLVIQHESPD